MKKIVLLLLFSFTHCFTVFTKDETILESEKLEAKEERDVYILTQSLTKDGLYLLLDAYRVKEENSVNLIKEKYLENKDFKWNDGGLGKDFRPPGCSSLQECGLFIVIATTIVVFELPTIPIRLMSEPQERIRKEIQTNNSTKIKIISTKNISFTLLDRKPAKEYIFKNDKIFIPMKELELDYFTFKSFPYKVVSADKKVNLLKGEFNFSKEYERNKEIISIVHENNRTKKSTKCRFKYPAMGKQDLPYEELYNNSQESCKKEYPMWSTDFSGNEKYEACITGIKECYEATRLSE